MAEIYCGKNCDTLRHRGTKHEYRLRRQRECEEVRQAVAHNPKKNATDGWRSFLTVEKPSHSRPVPTLAWESPGFPDVFSSGWFAMVSKYWGPF